MNAPENFLSSPELEPQASGEPEARIETEDDYLIEPHYVFYAHGVEVGTLPKAEYDDILRTVRQHPLVYLLQAADIISGLLLSYVKALALAPAILIAFFFAILWFDAPTAASLIEIVKFSEAEELVRYGRTGLVYCFGLAAMAMLVSGTISVAGGGRFLGIQNRFKWVAHLKVKSLLGVAVEGNLDCMFISANIQKERGSAK